MPRRCAPLLLVPALTLAGCAQPTGPEQSIEGERLFNQYCARCHGTDGVPTKEAPTASSFAVAANIEKLSDETIKGVIRGGKGQMPGFGDRFTEATLQVFTAYVRSLPGKTESESAAQPAP
ncbi:MAG: cytochrome c [Myxococcota bacterium]